MLQLVKTQIRGGQPIWTFPKSFKKAVAGISDSQPSSDDWRDRIDVIRHT